MSTPAFPPISIPIIALDIFYNRHVLDEHHRAFDFPAIVSLRALRAKPPLRIEKPRKPNENFAFRDPLAFLLLRSARPS
jgi:hypothetical protein